MPAAGLPADPDGERLRAAPYLTDVPESLEDPAVPAPPRILRLRTGEVLQPSDPGGEPLLYISFGSVTAGAHMPFYPTLYQAAIEALAPLPARLLLTVGEDRDVAPLAPLPANVQVQRWVPRDDVLHHAATVVTHGGHGSMLGALAHGVPVVVLPLFSLDQWFNAEAVARVALDGERRTRRSIDLPNAETLAGLRPAVEHVLSDPSPRAAARRVAAEMSPAAYGRRGPHPRSTPSPNHVNPGSRSRGPTLAPLQAIHVASMHRHDLGARRSSRAAASAPAPCPSVPDDGAIRTRLVLWEVSPDPAVAPPDLGRGARSVRLRQGDRGWRAHTPGSGGSPSEGPARGKPRPG